MGAREEVRGAREGSERSPGGLVQYTNICHVLICFFIFLLRFLSLVSSFFLFSAGPLEEARVLNHGLVGLNCLTLVSNLQTSISRLRGPV